MKALGLFGGKDPVVSGNLRGSRDATPMTRAVRNHLNAGMEDHDHLAAKEVRDSGSRVDNVALENPAGLRERMANRAVVPGRGHSIKDLIGSGKAVILVVRINGEDLADREKIAVRELEVIADEVDLAEVAMINVGLEQGKNPSTNKALAGNARMRAKAVRAGFQGMTDPIGSGNPSSNRAWTGNSQHRSIVVMKRRTRRETDLSA